MKINQKDKNNIRFGFVRAGYSPIASKLIFSTHAQMYLHIICIKFLRNLGTESSTLAVIITFVSPISTFNSDMDMNHTKKSNISVKEKLEEIHIYLGNKPEELLLQPLLWGEIGDMGRY